MKKDVLHQTFAVGCVVFILVVLGLMYYENQQAQWRSQLSLLKDHQKKDVYQVREKLRNLKVGDFVNLENQGGEPETWCVVNDKRNYSLNLQDKEGKKKVIDLDSPSQVFTAWQRMKSIHRTTDPGWEQVATWFWIQ